MRRRRELTDHLSELGIHPTLVAMFRTDSSLAASKAFAGTSFATMCHALAIPRAAFSNAVQGWSLNNCQTKRMLYQISSPVVQFLSVFFW